jgi:hypothetical protein
VIGCGVGDDELPLADVVLRLCQNRGQQVYDVEIRDRQEIIRDAVLEKPPRRLLRCRSTLLGFISISRRR